MKLYKDITLKEEIDVIDFGIVEAGSSKEITIYLYNDTKAILSNLEFVLPLELPEPEAIKVINMPKTIQPGKVEPMTIRWSPSMSFKQALEIPITIKGDEIYLAELKIQRK